ncbi:MAG: hypothetical protein DRQ63_01330 [Gammaproteobacteria bacterium]|nr:MAG: hypothetical protein DRQ63_01330 [Gammaproteobacteria bacterium]
MSDKKSKPKKPSFFTRMANRGREFKSLGQLLAKEPRAFPGALLQVIRRSVRTIWDARGGGYYACGFVLTFIWLEITMFVEDIAEATGIADFFGEQLLEMLFRYLGESFVNTIKAFMWPVYIIQISPPWGVAVFVLMAVIFNKILKEPVEKWLFHEDDQPKV